MGNKNSKNTDKKKKNENDVHEQYEFGSKIGEGATCYVVEGVDINNRSRKLAIKIMEKRRKRSKMLYEREVGILSGIKHENVVEFVEGLEDDTNYYVIIKLYAGGDLFERMMNPQYKITETIAISLITDMLKALKFLHENHIVHRDLKPENFIFNEKQNYTNMTLCDFGSAKIVNDDEEYKEVNKMLVGSVYYIAPELVKENSKMRKTGKLLKCSDIWSVGIATYIMLTGKIPFKGKTNKEYFSHIINDEIVFPFDVTLSKAVRDFILKILVKDPYKRMSIDEALRHPWIQGINDAEMQLNNDVIKYLEQFSYESKLKKAVTKALGANMGNESQVKKHFNRLDRNSKGYLDVDDLNYLLLAMGYAASRAKIRAKLMLKAGDANKDGKIDYNEFKQIWQRRLLCEDEKYIKSVFNVFDKNRDGYIDANELKRILSNVYDGYIQEMIQEVDQDNDGKLSFLEFKQAMLEQIYNKEQIM